jgi:hypothetical protein
LASTALVPSTSSILDKFELRLGPCLDRRRSFEQIGGDGACAGCVCYLQLAAKGVPFYGDVN